MFNLHYPDILHKQCAVMSSEQFHDDTDMFY